MSSKSLYILWDESQLWGLLAWHAAHGLGLAHRLIRAEDITQGLLADKPPAMLLVPGGSARFKAEALGKTGLQAIQAYVQAGGYYLGFCGGAGLGLSAGQGKAKEVPTLGLCPWQRGDFAERMQHFMSGHLRVELGVNAPDLLPQDASDPLLPVWWPGRFLPCEHSKVRVLARYRTPGEDFWLADLPIASLPEDAFAAWRDLYGLNLSPVFLEGQPCVVQGDYGGGGYILSYSHLETPASPFANRWLVRLLRQLGGLAPERELVPAWDLANEPQLWDDPGLKRTLGQIRDLLRTGQEQGLLFRRNDWLYGWRTGVPGAALNNLHALLASLLALPPAPEALIFWRTSGKKTMELMDLFSAGTLHYLLAERLAMTLAKSLPEAVPAASLREQRAALFGPPMRPGGLYLDILTALDTLAFLQLSGAGRAVAQR